jgi:hypothetical protein
MKVNHMILLHIDPYHLTFLEHSISTLFEPILEQIGSSSFGAFAPFGDGIQGIELLPFGASKPLGSSSFHTW